LYGITTEGKLGLVGSRTQAFCGGTPEQLVEDQIDAALPHPLIFEINVEDETMTWHDGSLVWRRVSQTTSG
jgi:hypothetical protein